VPSSLQTTSEGLKYTFAMKMTDTEETKLWRAVMYWQTWEKDQFKLVSFKPVTEAEAVADETSSPTPAPTQPPTPVQTLKESFAQHKTRMQKAMVAKETLQGHERTHMLQNTLLQYKAYKTTPRYKALHNALDAICDSDAQETCYLLGCKGWKGATCNADHQCVCPFGTCAEKVEGQSEPKCVRTVDHVREDILLLKKLAPELHGHFDRLSSRNSGLHSQHHQDQHHMTRHSLNDLPN
jgi:hypothetical protein